MLQELGIKRLLASMTAAGLAAIIVGLTDAGALGAYGAAAVGGAVFAALFIRADRRGEIRWSK